jgi:hypothetical protein
MAHLSSRMSSFNTIRRDYPLSDDQIRTVAPSIFADAAHASRSQRYAYIPTSEVLAGLRAEGFQPFSVSQSRTRIADRREHTRHLIRLRHVGDITNAEAAHEILVLNSHDGTSSYQMMSGMFRFVCANGLVCGDVEHDIKIRHSGDIRDNVIQGAYTVLNKQKDVADKIDNMRALTLSLAEQVIVAQAAVDIRFADASPIVADQLLTARRFDDRGNSLWNTFNRIQENVTQGGMYGRDAAGKVRKVREVTGMDQSTKLNRALWQMAESFAALKQAA